MAPMTSPVPFSVCYLAHVTKPDKTSRGLGWRNVILTDTSLRSNSSVWVFDANNLSFLREDHFDTPMQCVSFRLNPGLPPKVRGSTRTKLHKENGFTNIVNC